MLFGEKKTVIGKATAIIDVPKETLFSLIGEEFLANYQKWSPEVKELTLLTPPPLKIGSLIRQVRVDRGHKSESKFKVTKMNPEGELAFCEVSDKYRCSYSLLACEDEPEKTEIEFSFEFPQLETVLRPFEKLVRIAVKEGANQTVENLKSFAENYVRK